MALGTTRGLSKYLLLIIIIVVVVVIIIMCEGPRTYILGLKMTAVVITGMFYGHLKFNSTK